MAALAFSSLTDNRMQDMYRYDRQLLQHTIRVIHIKRDKDDEQFRCSFSFLSLHEKSVTYNALSYVWGEQSNPSTIYVEGKPLRVTRNLHQALLQIRKSAYQAPLWVNAICINQTDEAEKTAQVRLMKTIFGEADLVINWLGHELPTDLSGRELMRQVVKVLGKPEYDDISQPEFELNAWGLPAFYTTEWVAVMHILSRPWFTRAWIIQELLVAQRSIFLCGPVELERDLVLDFAGNVKKFPTLKNALGLYSHAPIDCDRPSWENSTMLCDLVTLYKTFEKRRLVELLRYTRSFSATDPRDKVFALVGLADDISNDFIDYGNTESKVSFDVASFLLTDDSAKLPNALDLLSYVEHRDKPSDLPSWVPDWRSCPHNYIPIIDIIANKAVHARPCFTVHQDKVVGSSHILTVHAYTKIIETDCLTWRRVSAFADV